MTLAWMLLRNRKLRTTELLKSPMCQAAKQANRSDMLNLPLVFS